MIYWSLKTLFSEPVRLAVNTLAVSASFILVVFFSAVFEGESTQMVKYLEEMAADVWVMQKGVSNMHMSSSMVWDWKVDRISELQGVDEVSAILYLNGPVKIAGKDWFSYIIGISPDYSRAGPWSMAQGKSMPGPGEAVIPAIISQLTGAQIGDEITMIDRKLRVVGLSSETFSMASSIVFVSREDLGDLLEGSEQYSYIMVYARAGVSEQNLIARITDEVDKVNAISSDAFIESDRQLALQMGAEIIRMMTVICTLLATLIVAFTAYSLIARKQQELAVAKALGFRNRHIYLAALSQSTVITFFGLLMAIIISFTLLIWLPSIAPQLNLSVKIHQFIPLILVALPVAVLASLSAARSVVKVDPMAVFQN
jgi:putative ABC transport system permease protein